MEKNAYRIELGGRIHHLSVEDYALADRVSTCRTSSTAVIMG